MRKQPLKFWETLKATYGTPLYVMDADEILSRINQLKKYGADKHVYIAYASKAFLNIAMGQLIKQTDLMMDVVSGGEIYLAQKAGVDMSKVVFHGNNKTPQELKEAVDAQVGYVVIDHLLDVIRLIDLLKGSKHPMQVLIRVNPQVKVDTHKHIQTGQRVSKFGMPYPSPMLEEVLLTIKNAPELSFQGFHFHVGSQLMTPQSHVDAIHAIKPLLAFSQSMGLTSSWLNMGGGFGVDYLSEDNPYQIETFLDSLLKACDAVFSDLGLRRPKVIIEPGRWLVAKAGLTLYTVGAVKSLSDQHQFINVDGGMFEHIRTALYDAKYRVSLLGDRQDQMGTFDLVGSCCESGDVLVKEVFLPCPGEGDLMVVHDTGAYHHSMASRYNKHGVPAVVMLKDDQVILTSKRETYEDLLRSDLYCF